MFQRKFQLTVTSLIMTRHKEQSFYQIQLFMGVALIQLEAPNLKLHISLGGASKCKGIKHFNMSINSLFSAQEGNFTETFEFAVLYQTS